ncbi:hypothetical protein [Streptomyces sp. RTd22]|uniref:hypothetical protein n=1 Tax=Streptomyces sp. RTd22 TaxID=1841249 RepID=UPI0007C51C4B|nr:hypothetical protein [Streptomyces sp. RTd22]
MIRRRTTVIALAAVLLGTALTACDPGEKYTEPWRDAPRSGTDNSSALVFTMPDGFGNGATKCLAGTGVRVTTLYHQDGPYGSVSTVLDPACK